MNPTFLFMVNQKSIQIIEPIKSKDPCIPSDLPKKVFFIVYFELLFNSFEKPKKCKEERPVDMFD